MKCNEDIDPMKKEIGLLLETFLYKHSVQLLPYTHAVIEQSGTIVAWTNKPRVSPVTTGLWIQNGNSLHWLIYRTTEYTLFTQKQLFWIENNWEDLLFSLGGKDE